MQSQNNCNRNFLAVVSELVVVILYYMYLM